MRRIKNLSIYLSSAWRKPYKSWARARELVEASSELPRVYHKHHLGNLLQASLTQVLSQLHTYTLLSHSYRLSFPYNFCARNVRDNIQNLLDSFDFTKKKEISLNVLHCFSVTQSYCVNSISSPHERMKKKNSSVQTTKKKTTFINHKKKTHSRFVIFNYVCIYVSQTRKNKKKKEAASFESSRCAR